MKVGFGNEIEDVIQYLLSLTFHLKAIQVDTKNKYFRDFMMVCGDLDSISYTVYWTPLNIILKTSSLSECDEQFAEYPGKCGYIRYCILLYQFLIIFKLSTWRNQK